MTVRNALGFTAIHLRYILIGFGVSTQSVDLAARVGRARSHQWVNYTRGTAAKRCR